MGKSKNVALNNYSVLKSLLENINESVTLLDSEGNILDGNSDVRKKSWFDSFCSTNLALVREKFEEALSMGQAKFKLTRANGRLENIKIVSVPEEEGQKLLAIGHDMTKIQNINSDLNRSQLRLSLATDIADVGIWEWDLDTNCCVFSPAQIKLLGLSVHQSKMDVNEFFNMVYEEDREETRHHIESSIRTGQKFCTEFRFTRPTGELLWLKGVGQLVEEKVTGNRRMIGVNTDITNEIDTLADLKKAKFDANTAYRAKSDFVANISHEIRTPMNSILGYADLLTRKSVSDHLRLDFATQIKKSGEHLLDLLNDVLEISKIEAGRIDVEYREVDLCELMSDVIRSQNIVALRKGLKLNLNLKGKFPKLIYTADLRIKQILLNLIGNALKFTKIGSVDIDLSFYQKTNEEGQVIIDVKDTGIGIDSGTASKLFEPFMQSDASISRKFGGTGLGLHLSKKLARHLNGNIALVESTPGKGSHFSFSFPVTIPSESIFLEHLDEFEEEKPNFTEQYNLPNRQLKILLVEDSLENQRLVKIFLSSIEAEIDIAENGEEAINYAMSKEYDLVFMDIMMPVLDGLSATRKLRELGFGRPIVALTAHAIRQEVEKCLSAGCNAHLAKPVTQNDLLKTVELYS